MESDVFQKEAYQFIDRLKAAGQSYWQILPLGPTGYGDSPYQSFSTFAGNPYFIDLETLTGEGLLTAQECEYGCEGIREDKIDYEKYIRHGFKYLRKRFRVLEKMTNTAHLFRKINFGWKIIASIWRSKTETAA